MQIRGLSGFAKQERQPLHQSARRDGQEHRGQQHGHSAEHQRPAVHGGDGQSLRQEPGDRHRRALGEAVEETGSDDQKPRRREAAGHCQRAAQKGRQPLDRARTSA